MRNVMASATEVELGGLFENCQKATSVRTALAEMGHQQPPTPLATYNTAANSIVNRTGKKKISSNRHEILLGQIQNPTKPFPHILGRGKEKHGRLCYKTPTDIAPYSNETQICQSNKTRHIKLKIPANWDRGRVCWNYQSHGDPETG